MSDSSPFYSGVRAVLLADTNDPTLASLVAANRWHGDQLPDGKKRFPALRMAVLADTPDQRLDSSASSNTAELQIDVYGERDNAADLRTIAERVYQLLQRADLDVEGYRAVKTMGVERPRPFKEHPYFRFRSRSRLFGNAA